MRALMVRAAALQSVDVIRLKGLWAVGSLTSSLYTAPTLTGGGSLLQLFLPGVRGGHAAPCFVLPERAVCCYLMVYVGGRLADRRRTRHV
jgi:hypothetical protein